MKFEKVACGFSGFLALTPFFFVVVVVFTGHPPPAHNRFHFSWEKGVSGDTALEHGAGGEVEAWRPMPGFVIKLLGRAVL